MLAAWLRMKHPSTFQGALAASAPILYFKNAPSAREAAFSDVATNDFAQVYPKHMNCSSGIKEGFQIMIDAKDGKTPGYGYDAMSSVFKTCKAVNSSKDVENLYAHVQNAFLYMAMTDYPYPSSFLQPMPAWPVNASCATYENITTDGKPSLERNVTMLTALKNASDIYFNSSGQISCTDFDDTDATGNLDGAGWNVLACNQLFMPTSMGKNSMFIDDPTDYAANTKYCQDTYGLTPDYEWALRTFGGYDQMRDFKYYSNIIFSNGDLDPWKAGGVTVEANPELPMIMIPGAAHHLDLRLPNEVDVGTPVEKARQTEMEWIQKWVVAYQGNTTQKAAPVTTSIDVSPTLEPAFLQ